MMDNTKIYVRTGVDAKVVTKLPKMSLKQWQDLAATKPRLITKETNAAAIKAHEDGAKKNLATLADVYKSIPNRLAHFNVNQPGDPAPTLKFFDKHKKRHSVRAINRDAMVHDALVARALLGSRTNKVEVYAAAFGSIQQLAKKDAGLAARVKKLPSSLDAAKTKVSDIDKAIAKLIDVAGDFTAHLDFPTTPPPGFPASCGQEEGTGNGGDSTGVDANLPRNPVGLLQNKNWPLKFFTTCIRNQGTHRGACPAFATIAAMESCIAVKKNRWVNLSEQDLYKHQKHDWSPFDDYEDGAAPPVSLLFQLLTGYRFPWERDWDYNPSTKREDDTAHHSYSHSCDLYSNPNCSDTNHQSHRSCFQIPAVVQREITKTVSTWVEDVVTIVEDVVNWFGSLVGQDTHTEIWGHWVDETVTEVVTDIVSTTLCVYDTNVPGTSGFGVSSALVFWDPLTDGQVGISLAKHYLSTKVPVIYCFWAMPSFQNAIANGGYVMAPDPNESPGDNKNVSDLGHCVCLTGFINNKDLPTGAPAGSGGGYFIAKNSWGTGFGDCGFAYLPYDWVIQWGTVMCTIKSITP